MRSAGELYEQAVAAGNAGRHAVAARLLDRAAARTSDPDLSARIVGTRAYVVAETGDPDQAIALCRSALEAPGLSAHTRAVLVSQVGLVELRRGDLDAALRDLGTGVGPLAADPPRLGRVLLNRALVHLERGDVPRAERDFAAAAEQFARSGEVVEQAKAQHDQGYAALVRGDLVRALRLMDDARHVLVALSPAALAVCDLDRAAVLRAAGESRQAALLLERAARALGARRLRQTQAEAELALADALAPDDPVRAAAVARRAARRFRARGNELGALRADAAALVAAQGRPGPDGPPARRRAADHRAALDATAAALDARGLAVEAWALRFVRYRLDVRTGRLDAARDALRDARLPSRAPLPTRLLAREVRAELAAAQGRPARALAHAAAGLDELERWQLTFGSADLQSGVAVHGRALTLLGVRTAVARGDPETVYEWSERARSIAARVVPLRPPDDPATTADLTELRRLRMLEPSPHSADGRRESELRDALRRRSWHRAAASVGRAAIVPLPRVREELDATGAELVAHLWTGDRLAALVVARSSRLVDLGPWEPVRALLDGLLADLDMAAAALPRALAEVVDASLRARLDGLDALLLRPLRPLLRAERVVLTPAGVLSGVPWELLGSFAATALTRAPSAARWVGLRRAAPAVARAGFLAGPGVPRADAEVRAAADVWPAREVLVGDAATTRAAGALAASVDLLHAAAHGRHSSDHPLFSGLELADGPWFGFDVDRLGRVPGTVVLSACELGRSADGWGREALGMAQSWLHAGARCVVAAGSSVNDEVAHALLTRLHRELAAGRPPSEALRTASDALDVRTTFAVHGAGW